MARSRGLGDVYKRQAVDWAIKNCPSFKKYILIELDWEDKQIHDCWFRFDVYFKDAKDATFYSLKWT
jgi:hypothetical protein